MSAEISSASMNVVAAPPVAAATTPAVAAPKADFNPQAARQELRQAINDLNDQMEQNERNIHFRMDERLGRAVIQVESERTGKVVRQIPNESALKVAHSIEAFKGIMLDENL